MSLSSEAMKAAVRRAVEPWNTGELHLLDEVCAPNYSLNGNATLQNLKDAIAEIRQAVPNLHTEVYEMVAEGDWVAYRWVMEGTHQGEYRGIAPTGKPIKSTGMTMMRFADGKIVYDTFESSSLPLEQQIS
jgi:predicted ester cyclase